MPDQNRGTLDTGKLDQVLEGYYPQMERDLLGLLTIPSVKEAPAEGAPFGRPIADALAYSLAAAESLGFDTMDVDGHVGVINLHGPEEGQVGVLCHLDVVPALAEEWAYPPYGAEIVDGYIYGRGTLDDKGPAIAALYALAALRDCCAPLQKSVRLLLGCDEESGMACMDHYLALFPQPDCGFSPDGSFPLIVGEKGILHFQYKSQWPAEQPAGLPCLLEAAGGTVSNVVPSQARAVFAGELRLPETAGISVSYGQGQTIVLASGAPAHASTPETGDNALSKLALALAGADFAPAGAKQYLNTLAQLFADSCYGQTLGIAARDSRGVLTCVPTVLALDRTSGSLTVDSRFLFDHDCGYYRQVLTRIGAEHGLELAAFSGQDPMFAGEGHPVAEELLKVYRDFTGDMDPALVIGGGTYAKKMKNFLAFGPEAKGEPCFVHQANEAISQAHLLKIAKIYARAIFALAK